MTGSATLMSGQCHCGAVRFEARLMNGFETIRRCNCSYCRMRGAVVVAAATIGVRILEGAELIKSYRFNTMTAEHFFCSLCGIYTHHQRRYDPNLYGVNVACLEGVSPFDFLEVPVTDGVHHPNDNGGKARLAGTLRFIPASRESGR